LPPVTAADRTAKPATAAQRWAVVILLGLGMMIAYVDRTNLSIALASDEFKRLFRLSDTDRGLLNSAFFWSYALLQIPAGYATDRYGVKWTYAISFSAWSIISAATALSTGFWQLFVLRLLLGVGEAIVAPASLRWIRLNVSERQRGLAVGILFAGAKIGPAVGADLSVRLLKAYGWQTMFAVLGLGCMVWLIPWLFLVKENDRQLELSSTRASGVAAIPFSAVWKTPAIYGIIIGTFAYNYFNYFCLTWLPAYFKEHWGLSLSSMGLYTAFSFLGMAAVAIIAGSVADRMIVAGWDAIKVRKGFTIAGLAVASTELIGPLSGNRSVALCFAIISLTGLGLATANYWALTQTLMPGAAIGRIAGVQNFASNLSGIAAPWLTGYLLEVTQTYAAPMVAVFLLLMTGILAYVFLVRPKYAPGVSSP
jgi:MFS family permease